MVSSVKACDLFLRILPLWNCCGIDAREQSGDILVSWNLTIANFKYFATIVGLMIEGKFCGMDHIIRVLNVYGPY